MMQIAVVGGTGCPGRLAVEELSRPRHEVRVLSRRSPGDVSGVSHARVDLRTGAGLGRALTGVRVVIDASNSTWPRGAKRELLVGGTRRLLAAEEGVGVEHHVLISIVGMDSLPFSDYGAKLEQGRLVTNGPVEASILRSTQFHQLVDRVFSLTGRGNLLPGGRGASCAPGR